MSLPTNRHLLLTSVIILATTAGTLGASPRELGNGDKQVDGTSHTSQSIPTASSPTSQAVPTSTPASALPTPPLPQIHLRTIFDFEKELELSADQVHQLQESVDLLTAKLKHNQTELDSLATTLTGLIRKNADEAQVKPILEKISALQIDGQLTDIRTSGRINQILTPQQKERWLGIQIGDRAHFTK